MKSLSTLIKLQKNFVDEQRQHLARLQDRLDQIVQQIMQLEITKAREQAAAQDENARATYGAFLKALIEQERALEHQREEAAQAVTLAQDKLSILFEEQKRYEIAESQRLEAEAKEQRRLETIELDEIGGTAHERQKDDHTHRTK